MGTVSHLSNRVGFHFRRVRAISNGLCRHEVMGYASTRTAYGSIRWSMGYDDYMQIQAWVYG